MVQLVFVHGVTVREGPRYQEEVDARRDFFRNLSFAGAPIGFQDPYWGEFGAPARYRTIPTGGAVPLAAAADANVIADFDSSEYHDVDLTTSTVLLDLARRDFQAFADLFSTCIAAGRATGHDAEQAGRLADFTIALMNQDGEVNTSLLGFLDSVQSDAALLEALSQQAELHQDGLVALGDGPLSRPGRWIVGFFRDRAHDVLTSVATPIVRKLTPRVAFFFGDAFLYFRDGALGARDNIKARVLDGIVAAARTAHANGEPLVLAGHSMGANILYDLLNRGDAQARVQDAVGAPLNVDLFLSVGAQLGLLGEVGLYESAAALGQPVRLARPDCVNHWMHVYNPNDVLSFGVKAIAPDAEEFSVDAGDGIIDAHGAYFISPFFHRRLNKRLQALGLVP